MSIEAVLEKTFCLFDYTHFVKLHVTPDTTREEVQNVKDCRGCLPRRKLQPLGPTTETEKGTSFVALDPMICCVGCPTSPVLSANKVKMFNPNAKKLNFDSSFPKMNSKRCIPAVAAIGGLIYVFGGLLELTFDRPIKPECIWAEYLDTSQPRDKQAWVALPNPPFDIPHFPVSFLIGDKEILVVGSNMTKKGLLFNVENKSWTAYELLDSILDPEALYMSSPVLVDSDHKTIYWLYGTIMCAFDLEVKTFHRGIVSNSVLDYYSRKFPAPGVPNNAVLFHLKNDVFCFFTIYSMECGSNTYSGILECTKIRVAKTDMSSGRHSLKIDVIGYQSYQCGNMWRLYGGMPISKGSKKRRNRHRKKHNH